MKPPKSVPIHCSVCGRKMGTKQGVQVVLGAVCDNPLCIFQEPPTVNEARDALIVAGLHAGIPAVQIAHSADMSRQRVYQIYDKWKQGV